MHGSDFLIDVDVSASGQVNDPSMLNVGINDGMKVNDNRTIGANRLLIFTGTATNPNFVTTDANLRRGVFRVRLRFNIGPSVIFKAAAATSALAALHGESDDDVTFDVNAAEVVSDPTDGGSLPQPAPPLPTNELYLIIDAACQGNGSRLTHVSYQANVLVQDLEPDLASILVRPAGSGQFSPQAAFTLTGSNVLYDVLVTLTGPVPQDRSPFSVLLESDHIHNVPLSHLVQINSPNASVVASNQLIFGDSPVELVAIIGTAITPKQTLKTADLLLLHLT
jgi:hypothetical protein